MPRKRDVLIVQFTALEVTEAAHVMSRVLNDEVFMSYPDTDRAAIVSAMFKLYEAQPAPGIETC